VATVVCELPTRVIPASRIPISVDLIRAMCIMVYVFAIIIRKTQKETAMLPEKNSLAF
jgi:hypothetical protein